MWTKALSFLSPEEELKLSDFIVEVGQAGYGKTRREIIMLAENVVRDKGMLRGSRVTSGWFQRFMERHPDLSLCDCLNSETMKAYFDLLQDVLDKNKSMDSPA